jgi:hypothetical protein
MLGLAGDLLAVASGIHIGRYRRLSTAIPVDNLMRVNDVA